MNWELAAQVVATLLLAAGITVSIVFGIKTLREVQLDRFQRVRPKLIFDVGGQLVHCELRDLRGIPGIDPRASARLLAPNPTGAKGLFPLGFWNSLTNHGNGSALNTTITILTRRVTKANESFEIDDAKLREFPYRPNLNHIPASPSNIEPGKSATFHRIPTPILVDHTRQLSSLQCVVVIEYEDLYRNRYQTLQELRAFVVKRDHEVGHPDSGGPDVLITLSDEIVPVEESNAMKKNLPRLPAART